MDSFSEVEGEIIAIFRHCSFPYLVVPSNFVNISQDISDRFLSDTPPLPSPLPPLPTPPCSCSSCVYVVLLSLAPLVTASHATVLRAQ